MSDLENISPRIVKIRKRRGWDDIELRCGGHKIVVQISNSSVHVNVGDKRISCKQHLNVVDVTIDESIPTT